MKLVPTLILLIGIPPLLIVLLTAFRSLDAIFKGLYEHDPDSWAWLGHPSGIFWRAPGESIFSGHGSRNSLIFSIIFSTPEWILSIPNGQGLHRRLRLCVLAWNIGCVVLFVLMYFFVPAQNA